MSKIIKYDTDGNAFAVVTDIAKYCEVAEKSVQRLIAKNIKDFNTCSLKIEERIGAISNRSDSFKLPKLELVKKKNKDEIDWSNVKLYQPHVELLLMLMKNTEYVKEHKVNLIADFFATKFELALIKQKEQERLIKKLQKENQKLHADKFIEYDDGYHSMSRIVKKNFPNLTTTEVFDMLDELGYIETEFIQTTRRTPTGLDIKTVGNKVIRYKEKEIVDIINKELQ